MRSIFFNYSGRRQYIQIIDNLRQMGVCEPSLLFGDDRLYAEFNLRYPGAVFTQELLYLQLHTLKSIQYDSIHLDFFLSEQYTRCKDQCMKMMDRIDDLGAFNRIDRESIIHRLFLFWISKIENLKPDALIFCDTPHTHETYALFSIAKYLGIPICILRQWGIAPCMYASVIAPGFSKDLVRSESFGADQNVLDYLLLYVDRIVSFPLNVKYEPLYMRSQRLRNGFFGRKYFFVLSQFKRLKAGSLTWARVIKRLPNFFWDLFLKYLSYIFSLITSFFICHFKSYDPKNPYEFSLFTTRLHINKRRYLLKEYYTKLTDIPSEYDLGVKYVYFPLHYEPEASTNPEGALFYDQYLAIVALLRWLPKDIFIFVKEHPSQFYKNDAFGYRGRSMFFYDAVKDFERVRLIPARINSFGLIDKCIFVSTITGTVAIEAAALGKKTVYFGDPWYEGAPNTYKWTATLSLDQLNSDESFKASELKTFLQKKYNLYCVPAMLNPSGINLYPEFEKPYYAAGENDAISHLIISFISTLHKNRNYA